MGFRLGRVLRVVLFVFGQDLVEICGEERAAAISKLVVLIFQGTNINRSVDLAHAVLPSSSHAEKLGTFTNVQGRVQLISPAVPPLGSSAADWEILQNLGERLGACVHFGGAEAIFTELAATESAFRGLTYATVGAGGALLATSGAPEAPTPVAAGVSR